MRLEDALRGVSSILLDTAPVIYHLERNPTYAPLMDLFFRICTDDRILLVTSPITLAECLVHPIQRELAELEATYRQLIVAAENTDFRPIGSVEASAAAQLRVQYNLHLADALQAATAVQAGCQAILTNDDAFKRVVELRALILDEIEL